MSVILLIGMRFPEDFRYTGPRVPGFNTKEDDRFGLFIIPGRYGKGRVLQVIAADAEETGWEHVSVSLPDHQTKCPSWEEMCIVKDLFWTPESVVVQFHPAASSYVNQHPGCLHLWRCDEQRVGSFPMPPEVPV